MIRDTGYVPSEGEILSVQLPSELIRATVTNVLNRNTVEAILDQNVPFTRLHGFGAGDRLRFKREKGLMGEAWVLVPGQKPNAPHAAMVKAQFAPADEHDPMPARPTLKPKVKRRSEIEAEKRG